MKIECEHKNCPKTVKQLSKKLSEKLSKKLSKKIARKVARKKQFNLNLALSEMDLNRYFSYYLVLEALLLYDRNYNFDLSLHNSKGEI